MSLKAAKGKVGVLLPSAGLTILVGMVIANWLLVEIGFLVIFLDSFLALMKIRNTKAPLMGVYSRLEESSNRDFAINFFLTLQLLVIFLIVIDVSVKLVRAVTTH